MSETPEERIYRRYQELGQIASNAKAERDALKLDIESQMEDGVQFDSGDQMLVWEFGYTDTFEWERMVKDGVVTLEVAKPYLKPTPYRKLVSRAKEPKKGPSNEAKMKAQSLGPELFEAVDKFCSGNGDMADLVELLSRAKAGGS